MGIGTSAGTLRARGYGLRAWVSPHLPPWFPPPEFIASRYNSRVILMSSIVVVVLCMACALHTLCARCAMAVLVQRLCANAPMPMPGGEGLPLLTDERLAEGGPSSVRNPASRIPGVRSRPVHGG